MNANLRPAMTESKVDDLLPCPFCGEAARHGLHGIPAVECSNADCGASLHRYHREEAYALWNMRVDTALAACTPAKSEGR